MKYKMVYRYIVFESLSIYYLNYTVLYYRYFVKKKNIYKIVAA